MLLSINQTTRHGLGHVYPNPIIGTSTLNLHKLLKMKTIKKKKKKSLPPELFFGPLLCAPWIAGLPLFDKETVISSCLKHTQKKTLVFETPPLQCFTTQMACVAYQYHSLSVQTIPTHTDSLKRLQHPIFLHEQFSPLDGYKAVDHFNQQTRAYRISRKIPTSIILSIIKSTQLQERISAYTISTNIL